MSKLFYKLYDNSKIFKNFKICKVEEEYLIRLNISHVQGQGRRPRGATPHPISSSCAGTRGLRGATPRSRSGGATLSKVRSSGCTLLDQP